ncbi:MAG TPA: hypothetical protein VFW20_07240 [Candidatus Limnocylindrales bacterium]|nr:hypothetical protein [Candidatus Limnocylindrales bacterium]
MRDPEAAARPSFGVAPGASGTQPVALLYGPGHLIVHGNPPFLAEFGESAVGLPASEVLISLPGIAFDVIQRVYVRGTPLACWIEVSGERRRLTAAPRRDPETKDVYGVAIRISGEPSS